MNTIQSIADATQGFEVSARGAFTLCIAVLILVGLAVWWLRRG